MIEDALITGLTQIANYRLSKRHHDLEIKEWQTKEIVEAVVLFQEEYERLPEGTKHLAERQPPQKIASGMCPECGSTLWWFQEGCATCQACGFSKCG